MRLQMNTFGPKRVLPSIFQRQKFTVLTAQWHLCSVGMNQLLFELHAICCITQTELKHNK